VRRRRTPLARGRRLGVRRCTRPARRTVEHNTCDTARCDSEAKLTSDCRQSKREKKLAGRPPMKFAALVQGGSTCSFDSQTCLQPCASRPSCVIALTRGRSSPHRTRESHSSHPSTRRTGRRALRSGAGFCQADWAFALGGNFIVGDAARALLRRCATCRRRRASSRSPSFKVPQARFADRRRSIG